MPRLVWKVGEKELSYRLTSSCEITIGRGADNEVQIDDINSSRRHCTVVCKEDGVTTLVDLDSRNGTYVNGELTEMRVLEVGDQIEIGTTVLYFFGEFEDKSEKKLDGLLPSELPELEPALAATQRLRLRSSASPHVGEFLEQLYMVLDLNKTLNRERNSRRILQLILDAAIRVCDAERGFLITEEGGRFRVLISRDVDQETIRRAENKVSQSVFRRVIDTGRSLAIANPITEEGLNTKSLVGLRVKAVVCVPIQLKGGCAGVLYLDSATEKEAFTDRKLGLVEVLAEQAALAMETANLIEDLKRRTREVEALNHKLKMRVESQARNLEDVCRLLGQAPACDFENDYSEIVTRSPKMFEVFRVLDRVCRGVVPILIQGESGTGKELVARAIHTHSSRSKKPFLSENCANIPTNLMESEFFGVARGAYSGAVHDKPGILELADGGTLFLDEIGDLHRELQAKWLRVIETGEVRRVGGKTYRRIDVRLVYATNRDLEEMIRDGNFREDLYYRLNVITVELPPLRERMEDIPLLAGHFLSICARREGKEPKKLTSDALQRLCAYRWPGNIRELENEIERANALTVGDTIEAELFSPRVSRCPKVDEQLPDGVTLKEAVNGQRDLFERKILLSALTAFCWNKSQTARQLGISRPTLDAKIEKHGLRKAKER